MAFWKTAIAALAIATTALAEPAFDPPTYLREAIATIRSNALYADQVDWADVERQAIEREARARDSIDTLDTVVWLLAQLNDNHSFPQIAADRVAAYQERYGTTPWPTPEPRQQVSTFSDRREPSVSTVRQRGRTIAHVIVPARMNAPADQLNAYASTLFDGIAASNACGYVVDLRGNVGGNSWPMLTGLSALLGQGRIGGYNTPSRRDEMRLQGGELWATENGQGMKLFTFTGWRPAPDLHVAPVAVLIDDATGSSGEATAIAFRGRAHTRAFGIGTAGASTSTQGFRLSDGTNLVIAVDVMADRDGVGYPHGVTPDVEVDPTGATAEKPDHAMAAALQWLGQQRGCRRRWF